MTQADSLELNIEEVHIHIHTGGQSMTDGGSVAVGASNDTEVEVTPDTERSRPESVDRGTGLKYDIRDKPLKGLILDLIGDSEGVTADSVTNILDAKHATVVKTLDTLESESIVHCSTEGFYTLNELGESVLETYHQRWEDGYKNLPLGYWADITS